MTSRIALINPSGGFLTRRTALVKAAAFIAMPCTNPQRIENVRDLNPTVRLFLSENVGLMFCKTSGGKWSAWHRWTAEDLTMPAPQMAWFGQDNFGRKPALLHVRNDGYWRQAQPGCIAFDLSSERMGRWKGDRVSPIKLFAQLCSDALGIEGVDGLHCDVTQGSVGLPAWLGEVGKLEVLRPFRDKIAVKQFSIANGPDFAKAERWSDGRALESFMGWPARQTWRNALGEADGTWCHYDGAEFGRAGYGYKHVAGPISTVIYNPWPGQLEGASNEQRHALTVGVFCMHMSATPGVGPYFAWHDTGGGGETPGILAPHRAELLEWTRMMPLSDVAQIPGRRVLYRFFTDDGGKKYSISVNLEEKECGGQAGPMSAERRLEQ